ncbi:MAG: PQQ-binding-like beta-propeller repeat protein [Tenuifilaceae bacterium]
MKKILIPILLFGVLISNTNSYKAYSQNYNETPQENPRVWKSQVMNSYGRPLVINNIVIPTFGIEYAIRLDNGSRLYYNLPADAAYIKTQCKDSLVLFRSEYKIVVKNIYTGQDMAQIAVSKGFWLNLIPIVIKDTKVLYKFDGYTLRIFDLNSKKDIWEFKLEEKRENYISNSFVSFGNNQLARSKRELFLIDPIKCKILWRMNIREICADPILKGDILYLNTFNDGIYAINIVKKEIVWNYRSGRSEIDTKNVTGFYQALEVDSSAVYAGISGEIYALSIKDGGFLWKNDFYCEEPLLSNTDYGLLCQTRIGPPIFFHFLVNKKTGKTEGRIDELTNDLTNPIGDIILGTSIGNDSIYCYSLKKLMRNIIKE